MIHSLFSTDQFARIFLIALVLATAVHIGLLLRQLRHVATHRHAVPSAFSDHTTLNDHQRAADYTQAKGRLALPGIVIGAAMTGWLTLGGGLNLLDQLTSGWLEHGSLPQGLALMGAVAVVSWLIDLPLTLLMTFGVEARFGFNRMTPALFISDTLKQTLVAVLIGAPLIATILWLMDAMGEQWWLYAWGCWLGFNLLILFLWPTFIAPLFNKFTPLPEGELRTRIEALLQRCGYHASGLFVMDGSKRSSHGNAYFTGFGRAKRIVFYDTLINTLTPDEIEAVLAHELGHFHHRHVWRRLGMMAVMSLVFLYLLALLQHAPWFAAGLGLTAPTTAGILLLFSLALPSFTFLLSPLSSLSSRRHEYQADAYAAQQTRASDLISALLKLYRDNASTLTPDPLYSAWHDSHPPAALRVAHLQTLG